MDRRLVGIMSSLLGPDVNFHSMKAVRNHLNPVYRPWVRCVCGGVQVLKPPHHTTAQGFHMVRPRTLALLLI